MDWLLCKKHISVLHVMLYLVYFLQQPFQYILFINEDIETQRD